MLYESIYNLLAYCRRLDENEEQEVEFVTGNETRESLD
jgi:hypothetical protein